MTSPGAYVIGRIGKPHGVKGEVTMQFTDDIFDRSDADYVFLDIDGILVPFFFESYRFKNDTTALVKFCDIDDADRAAELTGCDVYFPRDDSDDDKITAAEIIGYSVVNSANGHNVGKIKSVDASTVNILLTVTDDNGDEHLIPINEDLIEDIDKKNNIIRIQIPEGLLDL